MLRHNVSGVSYCLEEKEGEKEAVAETRQNGERRENRERKGVEKKRCKKHPSMVLDE